MGGTLKRLAGPAYIANAAANIYTVTASTYDIVRHLHFTNKTGADATFSMYVGATGASAGGTEIFFTKTVKANDVYDWYGALKLVGGTDFLTAVASAASTITVTVEGESFVT
jgi:hypothetical protein